MKTYAYLLLICVLVACAPSANVATTQRDYGTYQDMLGALRAVPGLQVTQDGRIYLRGIGTITNETQPLFVVDNVPLGRGYSAVNWVNPGDVANITIKKGLSATTRWGEDANHGVILINTKLNTTR